MPTSFFSLPPAFRQMVYRYLCQTATGDQIITPRLTSASSIAPFLRTCQQAHEEGTEILYGHSTFSFDNSNHVPEKYRVDVPICCGLCQHRILQSDAELSPEKQLSIPFCDYFKMGAWLDVIGKPNRLKIRHIRLAFPSNIFRRCHKGTTGVEAGGDEAVHALKNFARGHNLVTIDLSFQTANMELGCKKGIDWAGCKAVLDAFRRIRGIQKLRGLHVVPARRFEQSQFDSRVRGRGARLSDWGSSFPNVLMNRMLALLKSDMETGYETRQKV